MSKDRNRENEPTSREQNGSASLVRTLNDKGASVQFETRAWPLASIHGVIRQLCDIYNARANLNTDDEEGIREGLVMVSTTALAEEILARFDHAVITGRKHMRTDPDGNVHAYYRRWAGDREVCVGLASGMEHTLHLDYDEEANRGGEV